MMGKGRRNPAVIVGSCLEGAGIPGNLCLRATSFRRDAEKLVRRSPSLPFFNFRQLAIFISPFTAKRAFPSLPFFL